MQLCRQIFRNSCILLAKNWVKCLSVKILSNQGKNLDRSLAAGNSLLPQIFSRTLKTNGAGADTVHRDRALGRSLHA